MDTYFFKLNNGKTIPMVYKVGSYMLSLGIIQQQHPDIFEMLTKYTARPKGRTFEGSYNHMFAPKTTVEGKHVLYPIRDPVERFVSAHNQIQKTGGELEGISLEYLLNIVESGGVKHSMHTTPQAEFLNSCKGSKSISLFRFPEHLPELLEAAELEDLGVHNKSINKSTPSKSQVTRIKKIYEEDMEIYKLTVEPSVSYTIQEKI